MVGLEKTYSGEIKIKLDDLVQSNDDQRGWVEDVIYTFKSYEANRFENLDFSEKELADFGYSIIARLHAFYQGGEI